MTELREVIRQHPCLDKKAARWFGRIHLPVAPSCNIKCRYCTRLYDCVNESRPGVTSRVLTPGEALDRVSEVVKKDHRIRVVGIAGPGDPLANPETLETLELVHKQYPHLIKCISTNGLMLEDNLERLQDTGVKAVTVTVNAVCPVVGSKIYGYISYRNKVYYGTAGAQLLWRRQEAGIKKAAEMGMTVKINTVFIPGVNDNHLTDIARAVKALGAYIMNVMPLIPQAEFAALERPTRKEIHLARQKLAFIISQMEHCRQCRADAVGMLV